jgi:long-chain acyl-CoA synthetase
MLPNHALLELRGVHARSDIAWNKWTPDDVSLVAMPVAHIGGSGWGIMTLYNGAKGVVAREFDPNRVLDFIAEDRISKIFMVPAAMQIVVRHPKARETDFSCLKYILYGASPIPLELLKEAMAVFGCGFVQMYGMTETAGTIVALPPEDHDPQGSPKMRSAGKALPGVEVAILDEEGRRLGPGQIGEIATRSAANMAGYWNLPEATARTVDADGWLRTGDAGYLDEDGYLPAGDRERVGAAPGGARRGGDRGAGRQMGRGRQGGGRPRPGGRAQRGRGDPLGARADRGLQGAEERRLHRGLAAQRLGQDPQARAARALLGGDRPAGELSRLSR